MLLLSLNVESLLAEITLQTELSQTEPFEPEKHETRDFSTCWSRVTLNSFLF